MGRIQSPSKKNAVAMKGYRYTDNLRSNLVRDTRRRLQLSSRGYEHFCVWIRWKTPTRVTDQIRSEIVSTAPTPTPTPTRVSDQIRSEIVCIAIPFHCHRVFFRRGLYSTLALCNDTRTLPYLIFFGG